jgi:hypothetical protein
MLEDQVIPALLEMRVTLEIQGLALAAGLAAHTVAFTVLTHVASYQSKVQALLLVAPALLVVAAQQEELTMLFPAVILIATIIREF